MSMWPQKPTRLPAETLGVLQQNGFVQLAGLRLREGEALRLTAPWSMAGKYCEDNGLLCLVTLDGQVWVGENPNNEGFKTTIEKICPMGVSDEWIPSGEISEGVWFTLKTIQPRLKDPYCGLCKELATPLGPGRVW